MQQNSQKVDHLKGQQKFIYFVSTFIFCTIIYSQAPEEIPSAILTHFYKE